MGERKMTHHIRDVLTVKMEMDVKLKKEEEERIRAIMYVWP